VVFRVTIFGAESTGKTTLSKALTERFNSGEWGAGSAEHRMEFARFWLEHTGAPVTEDSMKDIWRGQYLVQKSVNPSLPYVFQDTDLYSTIGYWEFSESLDNLGIPYRIYDDAYNLRSDLYLLTPSNIPFESDPLRFGGDKREFSDDMWVEYLNSMDLPFRVLTADTLAERVEQSMSFMVDVIRKRIRTHV